MGQLWGQQVPEGAIRPNGGVLTVDIKEIMRMFENLSADCKHQMTAFRPQTGPIRMICFKCGFVRPPTKQEKQKADKDFDDLIKSSKII